jgi:hypothetical protein
MKLKRYYLMEGENSVKVNDYTFLKTDILELQKELLKEIKDARLWNIPNKLYDDPKASGLGAIPRLSHQRIVSKFNIDKVTYRDKDPHSKEVELMSVIIQNLPTWKEKLVPIMKDGWGNPSYKKSARALAYVFNQEHVYNVMGKDILETARKFVTQGVHHPSMADVHKQNQADELRNRITYIEKEISLGQRQLANLKKKLKELE